MKLKESFAAINYLICFILFVQATAFGQSKKEQVDLVLQKAEMFVRTAQVDSAKAYFIQAEELAEGLKPEKRVKVFLSEGYYFYRLMLHDKAKEKINMALSLIDENELVEHKPTALWVLGMIYFREREYTLALDACEVGMKMAKSKGDELARGKCLSCISAVLRTYYNTPKYTKALDYYEEARTIFETYQDTANLTYTLYILVDMYRSDLFQGKYDDLVNKYYQQFTAIINNYTDAIFKVRHAVTSGILKEIKGDYESANQYYNEVLPLCDSLELNAMTQHIYIRIVDNLYSTKAWEKALKLIEAAIAKHPEFMQNGFEERQYKILKELGQYEQALKYAEKSLVFLDSIHRKEQMAFVSEWETKYRVQEKEAALKDQELQIDTQRLQNKFLLIIIFLTLLIAGISGRAYYIQLKAKKKLAKQKQIIEQQSEELHQLDQIKSRFFANISHELRTPLTLILGPLNKVLKNGNLNNADFTLLKIMQQNGQDLLRLVEEILSLTKLESGKLKIREETVTLYPFVIRLISVFESYAQKEEIELAFEYKAATDLQIKLDKSKFDKILNNLLSNALKFTAKKGRITIVLADLQHSLQLKVTDSGRGIHPDDLPYIFDRFYQSKLPNAPSEGGTGIGLALVNELVKLMGGTIKVSSQLGKGSRFVVQFPKKEVVKIVPNEDALSILTHSKAITNKQADSINGKTDTSSYLPRNQPMEASINKAPHEETKKSLILYVEDNQHLREYIQLILQDQYQVIIANNGVEALDYLEEATIFPDLILSDVMMPLMDGFQLLNKLKNTEKYQFIPVIMLTARVELLTKLKALRIGVDDYLQKPFVEEELLTRIDNLLKNSQHRKQSEKAVIPSALEPEPRPNLGEFNQQWLEKQEILLQKLIGDARLNVSFWASQIAMSERHLHRKLKQLTGLTPKQYLLELKLNKARKLLENQSYATVAETAYALGFSNVKTFSRNYKNRFGKLPSDYKQESSYK